METLPETVFYLLSDLSDALADLSIAMQQWHMAVENTILDADNKSVLEAIEALHSIMEKAHNGEM